VGPTVTPGGVKGTCLIDVSEDDVICESGRIVRLLRSLLMRELEVKGREDQPLLAEGDLWNQRLLCNTLFWI